MNVSLEKILGSSEFTKTQEAAIRACFGPKWEAGKVYRRVGPPGAKTTGNLYLAVAAEKLGEGENGKGGYDMLNLTRKDRDHILAKFSPEKFVLVGDASTVIR